MDASHVGLIVLAKRAGRETQDNLGFLGPDRVVDPGVPIPQGDASPLQRPPQVLPALLQRLLVLLAPGDLLLYRLSYIFGQVVNIAAKLQDEALGDQILV